MKLAEAYGLKGCRVTDVAELEAALEDALAGKQATVIDCAIDIDEMVRPMVSGGSDIIRFMVD